MNPFMNVLLPTPDIPTNQAPTTAFSKNYGRCPFGPVKSEQSSKFWWVWFRFFFLNLISSNLIGIWEQI